jgi:hypothetical protein
MNKLNPIIGSLIVTSVIGFSGLSATAASIPVTNPGFEQPEQTSAPIPDVGNFDLVSPTGWSLYNPDNIAITSDFPNTNTAFTGGWEPAPAFFPGVSLPEGDQISSIYINDPPAPGSVLGLSQATGATIQPNTVYNLSVAVGNPVGGPFAGFPGYRVELLAGTQVIASDNNTNIAEGTFADITVSYDSSSSNTYWGEVLGIRLINPNQSPGVEVNFDNVRLDAVAVPETPLLSWQLSLAMGITGMMVKVKSSRKGKKS